MISAAMQASRVLVWEGGPDRNIGRVKVNQKLEPCRKRRGLSLRTKNDYKLGMDELELTFRQQWTGGPMQGPVMVRIRTYWPKRHRQGPAEGQGFGDWDACLKAVCDALQRAEVVEDDAQIECGIATKHHDPQRPRIEVEVKQWEE